MVVTGTLAYASQEPWIQSGTLKENILFGRRMDQERYDAVIRDCALERDLSLLPSGDETGIGDKGVNLSGGQKARVGRYLPDGRPVVCSGSCGRTRTVFECGVRKTARKYEDPRHAPGSLPQQSRGRPDNHDGSRKNHRKGKRILVRPRPWPFVGSRGCQLHKHQHRKSGRDFSAPHLGRRAGEQRKHGCPRGGASR
ncbi:unnamed protein product [Scytosiphon promiscuus]